MRRGLFIASVALCVLALTACFFSACVSDNPDTNNSDYKVTFIADGKVVSVQNCSDGDKVEEPAVPEKTGYTGSWQEYETDGGDKIVHAVYVPVEYVATFVADGVTVGALTFTVEDDELQEPEVPKKDGYVAEWEEYTLGASDITVNAVYIPGEYTVTFIADGNVVAKVPYKTGDESIDEPEVPRKPDYVGKWEDYVLSGNVTVNADYEFALGFRLSADGTSCEVCACAEGVSEVNIPEKHQGLAVTAIADGAFKDRLSLEKVTLPDTVEHIDSNAFEGCAALRTVNIPESVRSLGVRAFYGCASLEEVVLGDVFYLGDEAFSQCTALKTVTFGENLNAVGNYAFSNCQKLYEILLPDKTTTIGQGAFYGCGSLERINIPVSLTAIYEKTFEGCRSLISVSIPHDVAEIGARAFYGCSAMTELSICGSVSDWGEYAFAECVGLERIYFASPLANVEIAGDARVFYGAGSDGDGITLTIAENGELPSNLFEVYAGEKTAKVTAVIFEQGKTVLSDASNEFPFLKEVTVPESVAKICKGAMKGYLSAAVTVNGVFYLDGWAVACDELCGELSLPDGTRGIADGAFERLINLTSVYIPASIAVIGADAFAACVGITDISLYGEDTAVGAGAFRDCVALEFVFWNVASKSDLGRDDGIFLNSGSESGGMTVGFGDDVESIPSYIFCDNPFLESVVMSDNVTEISQSAFEGCAGLTTLYLSEALLGIGKNAFDGCPVVSAILPVAAIEHVDVTFLEEVAVVGSGKINDETFSECRSLITVVMDGISSVGTNAFYGCENLAAVSARNLIEIGEGAFYGCVKISRVIAPSCVYGYIPSRELKDIEICGDDKIYDGQFSNYYNLSYVIISDGITEIGANAFYGCSSLREVLFEDNEGWAVFNYDGSVSYVASDELSDEAHSAELLTGAYCGMSWIKG